MITIIILRHDMRKYIWQKQSTIISLMLYILNTTHCDNFIRLCVLFDLFVFCYRIVLYIYIFLYLTESTTPQSNYQLDLEFYIVHKKLITICCSYDIKFVHVNTVFHWKYEVKKKALTDNINMNIKKKCLDARGVVLIK